MVEIDEENPSKLHFRKLSDPNDTPWISAYKHFFRYASPNLFIWGPLAPAHDALVARSIMAKIQIGLGIILIGGTFRRFPKSIGKFRRSFTRITSFLGGSSLAITGLREVFYYEDPHSNPLYIEIQLARELSLLDPSNKGKPNKGSYWFGPKNFMPMNNEQYWKMVYSLEVNEIMADQYLESPIVAKCRELLEKGFGTNSVVSLKSDVLTERIEDLVTKSNVDQESHHSLLNSKTTVFPLFEKSRRSEKNSTESMTLYYWTTQNPFDALQLQEYKEFYAYVFPRLQSKTSVEKEQK